MKYIEHKATDRGVSEHGWLHSRFSFSFSHWYNPDRTGFGALRVINDDVIDPDSGFDLHPHDNMEIVTIVMSGAITHGDSMNNQEVVVRAGDVQVMTAGTGVIHAEHNMSLDESLQLYQIWIHPHTRQLTPRYDQKSFGKEWRYNTLTLLVSPDSRDESLMIHQHAFISRARYDAGQEIKYVLQDAVHGVYVFVISGELRIDSMTLGEKDALGIWDTKSITMHTTKETSFLLFEVPMTV